MSERRSARKRLRVHKHTYDALGGEPYAAEVVEVPVAFDKWDEAEKNLKLHHCHCDWILEYLDESYSRPSAETKHYFL